MGDARYGQQEQMEDASMQGTLAAQAALLWPQERPLMERLGLARAGRLLDLGCGTGRLAGRMAEAWPTVQVTGMDLCEAHLACGRRDFPPGRVPNLGFVQGDARPGGKSRRPGACPTSASCRAMRATPACPRAVSTRW